VRPVNLLLPLPVFLLGCQLFQDLKEAVDDLTQPILMQVVYIGLEEPDSSEGIDLERTKFSRGSTVKAVVYDANLSSGTKPASGAAVALVSDTYGSVGLAEDSPGSYAADGFDGLDYWPGDEIDVVADYGGGRHWIGMRSPDPASLVISEEHSAGMGISIDLRGQGFDNAVIVVLDISGSGDVIWESPFDLTQPRDSDNLMQTIPGDTFEEENLYVVGVVGLEAADEDDFHEVQVLGSGMLAGTMVMHPVSTFSGLDTGGF